MKIAVMSDIHGNYIALQRCLAHALEQNVDAYIFLGDYLGEFPYPQRTLEILYELKQNASCIFIRGNKEDYWLNRRKDQNCDWKSGNRSVMAMIYNYNSLNAKDLDFFETFYFQISAWTCDCCLQHHLYPALQLPGAQTGSQLSYRTYSI